ncbi:hypothetical protein FHW69_002332 [Luteibacter sp. Sphag1AF]|nr:hypothetical protein [Luteibacter sp. Sphag1AF]
MPNGRCVDEPSHTFGESYEMDSMTAQHAPHGLSLHKCGSSPSSANQMEARSSYITDDQKAKQRALAFTGMADLRARFGIGSDDAVDESH